MPAQYGDEEVFAARRWQWVQGSRGAEAEGERVRGENERGKRKTPQYP
jgi:hypothetical protein